MDHEKTKRYKMSATIILSSNLSFHKIMIEAKTQHRKYAYVSLLQLYCLLCVKKSMAK